MLVRLLVGLSGNDYSLGPGDKRDFPQAEAVRLVAAGFAVPHGDDETETADKVQPAVEKRKAPARRARGGGDVVSGGAG